ncbi:MULTISPECIES: PTS fructose transporter subunit IIB [Rhodococcus]|uniref:PTS fructose transporter subunit IIB n=1 Tax=Rhodococcus TaxID=1827 RepID=UPI0009E92E9E|nr:MULTISPECIES: hypothetical protein [Rhodococcus]QQZ14545.1 hypothetical protein GO592_33930 [Rhodococcus sp. 21391]
MKFVATTSCPTGIAHICLAAESLEKGAARSGHDIHVETQGASGSEPLDPEVIAAADGRWRGCPTHRTVRGNPSFPRYFNRKRK